jgi:FMN phosphatase YigB (HAD superfamily)
MTMAAEPVVFLLDIDNTLLDNDALKADVDQRLRALLGPELVSQFWDVYEAVRSETDTVNYPVVLERFAPLCPDAVTRERVRMVVMDYPFASRVYPETPATLEHLRAIGRPAILSDGDPIYQPLKIERSGLAAEVEGRVLVYVHKEDHLEEVMAQWPGSFYVAVDDKARILAETKRRHPNRFVTVHVRQGHYGAEEMTLTPAPDVSLAGIGDLRQYGVEDLRRLLPRA